MIDAGNNVLLFLLNLNAAFDAIDHSLLLKRLYDEIIVQGTVLEWFTSDMSCISTGSRRIVLLSGNSLSMRRSTGVGPRPSSVLTMHQARWAHSEALH